MGSELFDRSCVILMDPRPKPRPKILRTGRAYVPTQVLMEERDLAVELYRGLGLDIENQVVLDRPVRLDTMFVLPRPKALQFQYKKTGEWKYPPGLLPHTNKPDKDNLEKALMDAIGDVYAAPVYNLLVADYQGMEASYRDDELWVRAKKDRPDFWPDDSVVICGRTTKAYVEMEPIIGLDGTPLPGTTQPRTVLRIRELSDEDAEEMLLESVHKNMVTYSRS